METYFLRRIYLGGLLILFSSLFYYQILKGEYYLQRAKNNYVKVIPLLSLRGTIYDRNYHVIAYDKASFDIAVIPYQIKNKKDEIFKEIAKHARVDVNNLYKNYQRRKANLFLPVSIISDIDKNTALSLKENFGEDLIINPQPQRYYPYAYEFAHVLGYAKDTEKLQDNAEEILIEDEVEEELLIPFKKYGYTPVERGGFGGIEFYYDSYLKGEDGGDLIEVDSKGKMVGFLGERKPKKGQDIYLTIDASIQKIAYDTIKDKRGTLIFMSSQTGEIISMVSFPSFDVNCFVKGTDLDKFFQDKDKPLINRAIQAAYPLGSTFKPVVGIASLEEKESNPNTTFVCSGQLKLGQAVFKCSNTHSGENLYDAFTHSCNVYFYNLGMKLGEQNIAKWARQFGLDALTEIDLPYERRGIVPDAKWKLKNTKSHWFTGDTLNFSIGQGFMEATPLEVIVAINVFAANGYLVKPHIFKGSVSGINSLGYQKKYLGISDKSLLSIKTGLRGVVEREDGTAHFLERLDLKAAGKTGTAQTRGESHGWFLGFFPYDNPKYTICVFLENSGSSFEAVKVTYQFLKMLKEKNLL